MKAPRPRFRRGSGRGRQGARVKRERLRILAFLLCLGALASGWAQSSGFFPEGERLFRENKPREAASLLEKAILEPGADEKAWLYLALSYQQLGRFDEGLAVLRKGLVQARSYRHLYYYNMGNL